MIKLACTCSFIIFLYIVIVLLPFSTENTKNYGLWLTCIFESLQSSTSFHRGTGDGISDFSQSMELILLSDVYFRR